MDEGFREHGVAVGTVLSSPLPVPRHGSARVRRVESWEPLQGSLRDAERHQRQLVETSPGSSTSSEAYAP